MSEPTFAARLDAWLKATGMRQSTLAQKVGVKPPTVNGWLGGNESPRTDRLPSIAAALGISPAEFFGPLPRPADPADAESVVPTPKAPRRLGRARRTDDNGDDTTLDMTPSQMQATVGEDDVEDMPDALLDAIEGAQGKRGEAA